MNEEQHESEGDEEAIEDLAAPAESQDVAGGAGCRNNTCVNSQACGSPSMKCASPTCGVTSAYCKTPATHDIVVLDA